MSSKKSKVLKVLEDKKTITNVEALTGIHGFRTHKLSTIISELKSEGHVIEGYKISGTEGQYIDFIYNYKSKVV